MLYKLLNTSLIIFSVLSCGSKPDFNFSPGGTCKLDCSNPITASSNMELTVFETGKHIIDCSSIASGTAYPQVPIMFKIEKNKIQLTSAQDSTEPEPTSPTSNKTPVGGVSFQAIILEGYDSLANKYPVGFENVQSYKGLVTDSLEWCTDKCGAGIIRIEPICKGKVTTIKLLLHSGTIAKVVSLDITI
jgi:hypothetical protein